MLRGSALVGVGAGLVAAAVIAFVTWPTGSDAPAPGIPALHLVGSDDSDDARDDDGDEQVTRAADGTAFELEIDPELDARFGPRPVGAVRAAEIAVERFGGRVVAAELDEEGGRPIWEIELAGAAVGEVDVDAIDGRIR